MQEVPKADTFDDLIEYLSKPKGFWNKILYCIAPPVQKPLLFTSQRSIKAHASPYSNGSPLCQSHSYSSQSEGVTELQNQRGL